MSQDIDDLLNELKETKNLTKITPTSVEDTPKPKITDDTVNDFILDKSTQLIEQGINLITALRLEIISGAKSEDVEAYSKLVAAVTTSIDTMNKINIQNKKTQAAKELKALDIKAREALDGPKNVTNNIIIASREEVMNRLIKQAEDSIEVEVMPVDVADESDKR